MNKLISLAVPRKTQGHHPRDGRAGFSLDEPTQFARLVDAVADEVMEDGWPGGPITRDSVLSKDVEDRTTQPVSGDDRHAVCWFTL